MAHVVCQKLVMPGLVPGIHAFGGASKNVDGRVKPGHDREPRSRVSKDKATGHA